ncbi:MAG: PQQ-binding-like beta-propeller repeat protein [Planctomycetota bacterium]
MSTLCAILACVAATAQDITITSPGPVSGWSRFRGPNGAGRLDAGGLPTALDPAQNLRWRTPLPKGHSSPVLWQDRVYLTALDGDALCTLCLDADTGRLLWRRVAPRPRRDELDGRNHPASPTPAVDAAGVVVFFPEFGVLAYDHAAEERWRVPLGPFVNDYGMGASPILAEGLVLLACDQARGSYLIAIDDTTGVERWRAARPEARSGHCTPILGDAITAGTERRRATALLPGSFLLTAYDVATGLKVWAAPGLSFEMKSVPIFAGERVLINGYGSPLNQPGNQIQVPEFRAVLETNDADGDRTISQNEMPASRASSWFPSIDLDRNGELDEAEWEFLQLALGSQNGLLAFGLAGTAPGAEPELVWAYRKPVPQLPSLLYDDEVVYMLADSGGILTVIDPSDGRSLANVRIKDAVDTFYASPVMSADSLYLVSEHGLAVVLPRWRESQELTPRAVVDLGEDVYATPALAPGRVYVRTTEALYCFEAKG